MIPDSALRLLSHSFLFTGASSTDAAWLLKEALPADFTKGLVLAAPQAPEQYFGFILNGQATAYSGGNAILRSLGPGEIFGVANLYGQGEAVHKVIADSYCQVIFIPFAQFKTLLQRNWQVNENYLRFLSQRIVFLNRKITALTAGKASHKLAAYLLRQHSRDADGRIKCPVVLSKLALSLDISRATLYRALDELSSAGLVQREQREIIINNLADLQAYSEQSTA